jgi:hypothetical protein
MSELEFLKLDEDDFAILLPEETYTLGKKEIILRPLSLENSAILMSALRKDWPGLMEDLMDRGVTFENVDEQMGAIGEVMIHRVPLVLAIMTGVHPDSIARIPLVDAIKLFNRALKINLRDQDFFEVLSAIREAGNNFTSLMATKGSSSPDKASLESSTSSARQGINGGQSAATPGDS